MKAQHALALGTAAASLALAAPASAAPTFYFDCVSDTKIQNHETSVKWTEAKPAESFQSGAGCGQADPGPLRDSPFDGLFGGTYGGEIASMNVELHSLLLTSLRARQDPAFTVTLQVGDDVVIDQAEFRAFPEPSASGLTEKVVFSLTNLAIPAADVDRPVRLTVTSRFADYQHAWVYDAAEVPSHVEINPLTLARPRISR